MNDHVIDLHPTRSGNDRKPNLQRLVHSRLPGGGVRALYERLEQRLLGRTWTVPELAVGFTNDAAYVGRLVLAAERTWDIDGDVNAELRHKLAECLWWVFVLADKLGVDMPDAFDSTMDKIATGLEQALGDENETSGDPAAR